MYSSIASRAWPKIRTFTAASDFIVLTIDDMSCVLDMVRSSFCFVATGHSLHYGPDEFHHPGVLFLAEGLPLLES